MVGYGVFGLKSNPNLKDAQLTVERRDGRLAVRGQVASGAERDLAGLLARDAAGENVDNLLEIKR